MAQKERASGKGVKTCKTMLGTGACAPRNSVGRVVMRSIKTGQFTRSEIRRAVRKVISKRWAECHPD